MAMTQRQIENSIFNFSDEDIDFDPHEHVFDPDFDLPEDIVVAEMEEFALEAVRTADTIAAILAENLQL